MSYFKSFLSLGAKGSKKKKTIMKDEKNIGQENVLNTEPPLKRPNDKATSQMRSPQRPDLLTAALRSSDLDEDMIQLAPPTTFRPVGPPPTKHLLTPAGQRFEVGCLENVGSPVADDQFLSADVQQSPQQQSTAAYYNPPKQPATSDILQEIAGKLQLINVADALAVHAADMDFDYADSGEGLRSLTPVRRSPPERSRGGLAVHTALPKDEPISSSDSASTSGDQSATLPSSKNTKQLNSTANAISPPSKPLSPDSRKDDDESDSLRKA